jgi:hypothetical protein
VAPVRIAGAHFSPDTSAFLGLLAKHAVRYLIVDGEAVIFHGYARLTGDADFFYDREPANADRLFRALREFWDGPIPGVQTAAELTDPGVIIQFGVPPNRIDLINDVDGVSFGAAWESRVEAILVMATTETPIHYMSLDDLIRNKQIVGRPKDLDDLTYLRRARERH